MILPVVSLYPIVSILISLIVTIGITFIFYPAILLYYHHTDLQDEAVASILNNSNNSAHDEPKDDVILSLIIPAYNEEDRLVVMLEEAYQYLLNSDCSAIRNLQQACENQSAVSHRVEWVVVDDGSKDKTCQIYKEFVQSKLKANNGNNNREFVWKLISLPVNSGKGAAVQVGMIHSAGHYRLMVDADGATSFGPGLEAVTSKVLQSKSHQNNANSSSSFLPAIVFGSRHNNKKNDQSKDDTGTAKLERTFIRLLLMKLFLHFRQLVSGTPRDLNDTQCGFKLFDCNTAKYLFTNQHLRRWAFDIELVWLITHYNISNNTKKENDNVLHIQEVLVPWHEVDGSKLNTSGLALILVGITMLRDMICIRLCYEIGIWKIKRKSLIS